MPSALFVSEMRVASSSLSHTIAFAPQNHIFLLRMIFAISLICFTKDTSSRRSLIASPSQRSPRRRNFLKQRESRVSLFVSPGLSSTNWQLRGSDYILFKYLFIESKNIDIITIFAPLQSCSTRVEDRRLQPFQCVQPASPTHPLGHAGVNSAV